MAMKTSYTTPWDTIEWSAIGEMLERAKEHLSVAAPAGYTVGWNVGAVAGQEIFHAHMHVIARFNGEESAGNGPHAALKA